MIKLSYLFLLIAIVGVTSCNEDELELIDQPSTEVVAIAKRNIMLTGNDINDSNNNPKVVKWWRSNFSNVDYNCEGKEDEKLTMGIPITHINLMEVYM